MADDDLRGELSERNGGINIVAYRLRPWYIACMQEIQIAKFKATCLSVLDQVAKTRKPVPVTRFAKPVARILPPPPSPTGIWLDAMKDSAKLHGDLIAPVTDPADWEALTTRRTDLLPRAPRSSASRW